MKSFGFGGECACWLLGALLACLGMPAIAATYAVTNTNDAGAGSLRQAMLDAMASPAADTIVFSASANGVTTLASPLPDLLSTGGALTIAGNGAASTIIDGAGQYRPFKAEWQDGLHFNLVGLTVRNGFADQSQGGAIFMLGGGSSARLVLDAVELVDNRSTYNGGAVYASASTSIEDSLFAGNDGGSYGGGIHIDGSALLVRNTTFSDNVGGVIRISGSGNANDPVSRLVNVTATGNRGGDDAVLVVESGARVSLSNTLIGGSIPSIQLYGDAAIVLAVSFNNVLGNAVNSGFQDGVNGNQVGVVPSLIGPLGDHGGATRTLPLLPGSPALDAGTDADGDIPAADQRGVARVGPPDVGAFESQGFTVAIGSGNGQSTAVGTPFAEPLVAAAAAVDPLEPVAGGIVRFSAPASGPSAVFTTPDATIGSDGAAQAAPIANNVVGGPYVVTASLSATQSIDFSLTNAAGVCGAFTFPYTLSGTDNTARVAELRQAIECANINATVDEIDLGGNALVFGDASYTDANGTNALPFVTSTLTLGNGALERDAAAAAFRFLDVATTGNLTVSAMQMRNGASSSDGGAIRADGDLTVQDSVFEDNRAATLGGAVATHATTSIGTSRFARNVAPDGAAIAGGDDDAAPGGDVTTVYSSHFTENGDAASRSVIWNKSYFGMFGSLISANHLSAADSALLHFHDDTAVAELRNVTIVGNSVQGQLFSWQPFNVQVRNSIVWDNSYTSLGNVSILHTILPGAPASNGNIDQAPGFVDPSGDYRLAAGSPAIDAGHNNYGGIATDLDGNPRNVDDAGIADTGVGNAPILDIGAYERQTDSGTAGITVAPTSGLLTNESGGTASFTVVLDRYPGAAVMLTLSSSNSAEGAVAPTSLAFTQANWNQPRTVTVSGVDDGVIDGDQPYAIVIAAATSADPAYAGIDPPDVSVVNQDDEAPTHALHGTVVGLLGSGLALTLNAGEILPIAANGSFAFATLLAPGEPYAITVASQPQNPSQTCVVINGAGTMGAVDIDDVIVNCGASVSYAVGGMLAGLGGGGLTLQLNGAGDLALSADGSYAFGPRLTDGSGYVVTIRTQPQGHWCTLANATGSVQGADISNVDVTCAPLQAELYLSVDDAHAFARYGRVRDYFVTLGNTGNAAASGIAVSASFSAAFDVANVQWQCVGDGGGASCASSGSGGFTDTADIPANASLTWIVSVPVFGGSNEPEATFTGLVDGAPLASDTDTLVIFRDGYDIPYADGTLAPGAPAPTVLGAQSLPIEWPASSTEGLHSVHVLATVHGTVEVQRLRLHGADFVRLLGTDTRGHQRISAWVPVSAGAQLVVAGVAGSGTDGIVLLEGAVRSLALPMAAGDYQGEIE